MVSPIFYEFAADVILFTHVLFVAFVIFGLFLIFTGKLLRWPWVRNPWFRLTHLSAIGVVVLQSWFGIICPLTTWEMALRSKAGDIVYPGSFAAHWLQRVLYWEASEWIFSVCYTLFGLLVVFSWFCVKPRSFRKRR